MNVLRRMSLTTRFGFLFFMVSILIFAGVGTYLYLTLSSELESRDDQELVGKIGLMRHIAEEAETIDSIRKDPHYFLDVSTSHEKLIVLLKDSRGDIVLHTNAGLGKFPQIYSPPLNVDADRRFIKSLLTSIGLTARAIAVKAKLKNGEQLDIIVARTMSDRMELLNSYRADVWKAAIAGTLLAALFGLSLIHI